MRQAVVLLVAALALAGAAPIVNANHEVRTVDMAVELLDIAEGSNPADRVVTVRVANHGPDVGKGWLDVRARTSDDVTPAQLTMDEDDQESYLYSVEVLLEPATTFESTFVWRTVGIVGDVRVIARIGGEGQIDTDPANDAMSSNHTVLVAGSGHGTSLGLVGVCTPGAEMFMSGSCAVAAARGFLVGAAAVSMHPDQGLGASAGATYRGDGAGLWVGACGGDAGAPSCAWVCVDDETWSVYTADCRPGFPG